MVGDRANQGNGMGGFHGALIDQHASLLEKCRPHPFMAAVADGTIPEERFLRWLCQEQYWIREFEGFLSQLAVRSPRSCRRALVETVVNAGGFREALERIADERGIDLSACRPDFPTHAYVQFLLATVHVRSFEKALSACFAAHYAYLESWSHAVRNQTKVSPWQDFIDLRTTDSFKSWTRQLGRFIDSAAEDASERTQSGMMQFFGMSLHYYIRCWDAALDGTDW